MEYARIRHKTLSGPIDNKGDGLGLPPVVHLSRRAGACQPVKSNGRPIASFLFCGCASDMRSKR